MTDALVLNITDLSVEFGTHDAPISVVKNVSMYLEQGEIVGLVGESGSGKSVIGLSVMSLLPPRVARISNGSIFLDSDNIQALTAAELRQRRARKMAMIFQEPMTALSPTRRIQDHMQDILQTHESLSKEQLQKRMFDGLAELGLRDPETILSSFPFQLSGGMRQRVLIAMALLMKPQLIIADEITTALDVTVQAQVLGLLLRAAKSRGVAVLLISHDLAVVRHMCQRVYVIYRGEIVESGSSEQIIDAPRHPYTRALISALPERHDALANLAEPATGTGAGAITFASGSTDACAFLPRCTYAIDHCASHPSLVTMESNHVSRCWRATETNLW